MSMHSRPKRSVWVTVTAVTIAIYWAVIMVILFAR